MPAATLSPLGEILRRHDPDRYLTALFAPAARREALFALYAFDHELARARAVVSEPMLALIRLQWWREVVEGAPRRHEVATPLSAALQAGLLPGGELSAVIEAREIEAEPVVPTLQAWREYLLAGAGGIAVAAGVLLGAPPSALPALRLLGAAYGVARTLGAVRIMAKQQRCLLPAEILASHGLQPEVVIQNPGAPALRPVRHALAAEGQQMLRAAGRLRLGRGAIAAGLPGVLARRDLARPDRLAHGLPHARGPSDQLAVIAAGVLGRVI